MGSRPDVELGAQLRLQAEEFVVIGAAGDERIGERFVTRADGTFDANPIGQAQRGLQPPRPGIVGLRRLGAGERRYGGEGCRKNEQAGPASEA